ncbi:hypothetical protein [Thioalbus denitrificans]|uniref:Uncharacterized protein n=1 Tax=Thioalbus denitrificans TaxID=547122 RepID=A0A369BK70_9GAMM|nr:hypothetical protein [Thioalbus denitrificans]RCX21992.1 hypothetical protein DFQ59_1199 [Thioalbus denitrificans]
MSDAWVIAVAAAVLLLHGGVFLLTQALHSLFWPVPALNGAIAGGVLFYWLDRWETPGTLAGADGLFPLVEGGVLLLSVLGLLGILPARGPHWLIFAVNAILALAFLGFMLVFRLERLF